MTTGYAGGHGLTGKNNMDIIVSKNNTALVEARKLLDGKFRDKSGQFLVEGVKLINEAVKFNQVFDKVFVSKSAESKLGALLSGLTCRKFVVEDNAFETLTDTVTSQGVAAVINKPSQKQPGQGKGLVLYKLQDTGNMGTILRTAAATGYNDVFLVNCADVFSPKCLRAGMSAQFVLNLIFIKEEDVLKLKNSKQLVCCDMNGKDVFDAEVNEQHLLFLGNEGQGLPEFILDECDMKVKLEMENNLESLNVAVSAGVVMYVLNRKTANKKNFKRNF